VARYFDVTYNYFYYYFNGVYYLFLFCIIRCKGYSIGDVMVGVVGEYIYIGRVVR
jgi:hypothetical protein